MSQRPRWFRCFLLFCLAGSAWAQGGPPGASVSRLLTFPARPNLVYAATSSGVLRSDDGGQSWAQTGDRLRAIGVSALAGDETVLYAGSPTDGVFRSRDDAATWEQINQGIDVLTIVSLAIDPTNANIVYAGSSGGGIFKTINSGDQWTPIRQGLPEGVYLDIKVDPNNTQIVYVAHTSLASSNSGTLLKSVNGGQQWNGSVGPAIYSVTLDPSNSNVVYVGSSIGIIKTTDGGATFPPLPVLAGVAIVDVAVDPTNSAVVYAASRFSGVVKSSDSGQTWGVSSNGLPRSELSTVALNTADSSIVYAGTNGGGLFRSEDAAASWDLSSQGMNFAAISALAVAPGGSNVLAAVPSAGAYRSTNGGISWGPARNNLGVFQVQSLAFSPSDANIVYGSSVNPYNGNDGSLFKSADGGREWQSLLSGAPIYVVVTHPTDPNTIFIGVSSGVYRSRDGGQKFDYISGSRGEASLPILDLAVDPTRPDTIFAVTYNSSTGGYEIYRTTNGGGGWTGAGATAVILLNIEIDPANTSRVYVASNAGVIRSTDGGRQYRTANSGLPNNGAVFVTSIAIDAKDNSALYAATTSGVFRSADGADSWQLADSGLEQQGVVTLVADPAQAGVIYAATTAGGVFKTADRGQSWKPTGGVPFLTGAGIVNAASFKGGGVAPGEIVSLFGLDLGPAEGVQPGLDPQTGKLATSAAGVRVLFGDIPAPLFFVRADQLNVQVPFEVAGMDRVKVSVEFDGAVSARASVPVVETDAGLFQAVLNQDFSVNSADHPESSGRFVQLFATGQGLVDPAVTTGQLGPGAEPFPRPTKAVKVTIGGKPAVVYFAGLAPGFVGLLQINAQIDSSVRAGEAQVTLQIGETTSQVAGRVWVR